MELVYLSCVHHMAMDLRNKFGFKVCLDEVWTFLAEITYLQEKATIFF